MALIESIRTKTMIGYRFSDIPSHISTFLPRIIKYSSRGWNFLVSKIFNKVEYRKNMRKEFHETLGSNFINGLFEQRLEVNDIDLSEFPGLYQSPSFR